MNIYKDLKDILSESERLNNHKTIDKIVDLTIRLSQVQDDVRTLNELTPQQELEILRAENAELKNNITLTNIVLKEKGVNLEDLAASVSQMKQMPDGYNIKPSANLAGATVFEAPFNTTTVTTSPNNAPPNSINIDLNTNTTSQN